MARPESITIKTDAPEHRAARDGWIGAALGAAASVILPVAAPLTAGVGAVIGYLGGQKQDQENEQSGERTFDPPTLFNSGMAKGALLGMLAGAAIATVSVAVFAPALFAGVGAIFAGQGLAAMTGGAALGTTSILGLVAGGVGSVLATAYGAVSGANARHAEMEQEYEQAAKIKGGGKDIDNAQQGLGASAAFRGQQQNIQPEPELRNDHAAQLDKQRSAATAEQTRIARRE